MSGLDEVRASQDRDLGAEGIPMYVVLVDETGGMPEPGGGCEPLADRLDALRAELAPSQRDDDLGLTATLLAAAAFVDRTRTVAETGQ